MPHNFETKRLNFGAALDLLVGGHYRVRRAGWNGTGMWLAYVPANRTTVADTGTLDCVGKAQFTGVSYDLLPWIGMKTADDTFVPWLASQTDILAQDWELVE